VQPYDKTYHRLTGFQVMIIACARNQPRSSHKVIEVNQYENGWVTHAIEA
jgi:hypothetical protein